MKAPTLHPGSSEANRHARPAGSGQVHARAGDLVRKVQPGMLAFLYSVSLRNS